MFYNKVPIWRNWIARMTSNHEVAGSSRAMGGIKNKIMIIINFIFLIFF